MSKTKVVQMGSRLVTLDFPITEGEQEIKELILNKPNTEALRGIALSDLVQMKTDSLEVLLPRIAQPMLTIDQIREIDPADLLKICMEVLTFLLPKATQATL